MCDDGEEVLSFFSTFSNLIKRGNVSPCPSKVNKMVIIVRKIIRSRKGKSAVSDKLIGKAIANASDTRPRMPAQDEIIISRQENT